MSSVKNNKTSSDTLQDRVGLSVSPPTARGNYYYSPAIKSKEITQHCCVLF